MNQIQKLSLESGLKQANIALKRSNSPFFCSLMVVSPPCVGRPLVWVPPSCQEEWTSASWQNILLKMAAAKLGIAPSMVIITN
jgi:hypothetical protein